MNVYWSKNAHQYITLGENIPRVAVQSQVVQEEGRQGARLRSERGDRLGVRVPAESKRVGAEGEHGERR